MERLFSEGQFDRLYALLRRERKSHTKQREAIRRFAEAILLDEPQRRAVALPAGGLRGVEQCVQALRAPG
jgi:hypothetical protein